MKYTMLPKNLEEEVLIKKTKHSNGKVDVPQLQVAQHGRSQDPCDTLDQHNVYVWEVSSLPFHLGGLGLWSASRTIHAACWGSWAHPRDSAKAKEASKVIL